MVVTFYVQSEKNGFSPGYCYNEVAKGKRFGDAVWQDGMTFATHLLFGDPLLSWDDFGRAHTYVKGDFLCPNRVDFIDFSFLAGHWMEDAGSGNWNPACDISDPNDDVIDELDLAVFADNWLK